MKLSKVQQEAVDFYKGSCNVIAAAGSGKTAVLVNRIVKLIEDHNVEPSKILAITFSKKAKENMINRLTKMIPNAAKFINIETFHSFGFRVVRKFNKEDFDILDADWKKVKIIEEILERYHREKDATGQEISDILSYISLQKNQMKSPDRSKNGRIYNRYEEYKAKHNLLDFDDMLVKCYEILKNNSKGLKYCQEQYQFILADEMQDTNAVQYEIIRLIGEKHKNVFVVGDGLQAIYQWRGSDNRYIMNFDDDWPNTKIIHLNKNYRSSADIIETANQFAQYIPESKHRHYVESIANKGRLERPHYVRYSDGFAEANGIAQKIHEYVDSGYKYKDIAILTRTNAQLQNFETSLCQQKIPYTTLDGSSFIDRNEIKTVLCYLRLICDINDDEAFEFVYNRPNRYLGKDFLRELKRIARKDNISLYCAMFKLCDTNWRYRNPVNSIHAVVKSISESNYKNVGCIIKDLREKLDLDSYVSKGTSDNDDSRVDNLNTLEHSASRYKDADKFIYGLSKLKKEKSKNANSVQLMTIHKSKGLEFPIVFVAGADQGLLPHAKNDNVDEEKRLMYVAITRAEKILNVSSTESYNGKDMQESDFVKYLFRSNADEYDSKRRNAL